MQHCTVLREMLLTFVQGDALVLLPILIMLDSTVGVYCSTSRLIGVGPFHPSTLIDLLFPDSGVVQTPDFLPCVHRSQELRHQQAPMFLLPGTGTVRGCMVRHRA